MENIAGLYYYIGIMFCYMVEHVIRGSNNAVDVLKVNIRISLTLVILFHIITKENRLHTKTEHGLL